MLQINIEERDGTDQVFSLCGELVGSCQSRLIDRWNEYKALRKGVARIVDISEVTTIDQSGERVIRSIACDGARFRAKGPMMGRIIDLVCQVNLEMLREGHREFRSTVFCG